MSNRRQTITFQALPQNLSQLKNLPQAAMRSPFETAALFVAIMCAYPNDPGVALEMLDFIKGPRPLSMHEKQFIADRMRGKPYIAFSYFEGATPANNYTPVAPLRVTVSENPYSYQDAGYAKLFLQSGGADSPRPIVLRNKPSTGEWFLWEQLLLADIRKPVAQDEWA